MLLTSRPSTSTFSRRLLATLAMLETAAAIWEPAVGATWQINLQDSPDTSLDVDIFNVDLFDTDASVIAELHDKGRSVMCYFSAGTYEDWRPDAGQFNESILGNPVGDWPGERWLDTRTSDVKKIMLERLDLAAAEKRCDGVDPDNVDGYTNDSGFGISEEDAIDYMNFVATQAHLRQLSVGLKNAGGLLPPVIAKLQWAVTEQCFEYEECATFAPLIEAGRPVFQIEYPKDEDNDQPVPEDKAKAICNNEASKDFSTIFKNTNLDSWFQTCDDF